MNQSLDDFRNSVVLRLHNNDFFALDEKRIVLELWDLACHLVRHWLQIHTLRYSVADRDLGTLGSLLDLFVLEHNFADGVAVLLVQVYASLADDGRFARTLCDLKV